MAYEIYTLAELQDITPDHLADECILMNDIDASATSGWNSGAGFIPIGNIDVRFGGDGSEPFGTFNGQGHTISNLFINRSTTDYVGLFGAGNLSAGDTNIQNVNITNANIKGRDYVGALIGYSDTTYLAYDVSSGSVTGRYCVGGLVGWIGSDGNYTLLHSSATVIGISSVGGLVGLNDESMSYCYATGEVSGSTYVGGLIGQELNDGITNCYATGDVYGNDMVGGLIGQSGGGSALRICYSTGNVYTKGGGEYVTLGGLLGYGDSMVIENCYSTGNVDGSVGDLLYTGGLVGYFRYGTVTNSYATGQVQGRMDISWKGGLIGEAPGSTITNCYATGVVLGNYAAGLVGNIGSGSIVNCGWWTGQCSVALGSNEPVTYNETLKSAYFDKTHNIYDGGDIVWDFSTPIWYQWTNNFPLLRKYKGKIVIIN